MNHQLHKQIIQNMQVTPCLKPETAKTAVEVRYLHAKINKGRRTQQGIVLFIVMIIVLITSLLVLWASRSSLFNEIVTGNEADYQRTFEAAQAMLRDAELDVLGIQVDGSLCVPDPAPGGPRCRPTAILANMDLTANPVKIYYPVSRSKQDPDGGDLVALRSQVDALPENSIPCRNGICSPTQARPIPGNNDFWKNPADLEKMTTQGARYGEFTGAPQIDDNPLLTWNKNLTAANDTTASSWYWVETLDYQTNPLYSASIRFAPLGGSLGNASGYVFRITAVARGRKPGTLIALQKILVKQESRF